MKTTSATKNKQSAVEAFTLNVTREEPSPKKQPSPSARLRGIIDQLDAFSDEFTTIDVSDVERASAELELFGNSLAAEGI